MPANSDTVIIPEVVSDRSQRIDRLDRLAKLLDSALPIAGGKLRVGLDPLLGLIPGLGDTLGMMLSCFVVYEAARLGVSRFVLARMIGNVAIDGLIGVVPIVGDLFDFVFQANRRNVKLLRRASPVGVIDHEESLRRIRATLAILLGIFLVLAACVAYASFEALGFLVRTVGL